MSEKWAADTLSRYILLNRNGSANLLEASSRNYNPLITFNELKSVTESVYQYYSKLGIDIVYPNIVGCKTIWPICPPTFEYVSSLLHSSRLDDGS